MRATEAAKSIASPVFPILPQDEALFQKMKYEFLLQIFGLNFEWNSEGRTSSRLDATLGG